MGKDAAPLGEGASLPPGVAYFLEEHHGFLEKLARFGIVRSRQGYSAQHMEGSCHTVLVSEFSKERQTLLTQCLDLLNVAQEETQFCLCLKCLCTYRCHNAFTYSQGSLQERSPLSEIPTQVPEPEQYSTQTQYLLYLLFLSPNPPPRLGSF